jgi:hypothetical protein
MVALVLAGTVFSFSTNAGYSPSAVGVELSIATVVIDGTLSSRPAVKHVGAA